MTISATTSLRSEIEGDEPLSAGVLGYLCARNRDAHFDFIHRKLADAESRGVKRSEIASRIGKSPTRLSHLLGAPGNWTLDTIAELLVAICREEPVPASQLLLREKLTNRSATSTLEECLDEPAVYKWSVREGASLPSPKVEYLNSEVRNAKA